LSWVSWREVIFYSDQSSISVCFAGLLEPRHTTLSLWLGWTSRSLPTRSLALTTQGSPVRRTGVRVFSSKLQGTSGGSKVTKGDRGDSFLLEAARHERGEQGNRRVTFCLGCFRGTLFSIASGAVSVFVLRDYLNPATQLCLCGLVGHRAPYRHDLWP
jgi:hypothetical protein